MTKKDKNKTKTLRFKAEGEGAMGAIHAPAGVNIVYMQQKGAKL